MDTQISAFVSDTTKERLERYVRKRGVKKGYVIEQALSQYLTALEELPEEYIVPTRIVLTNESFDGVMETLERPPKPNKALKQYRYYIEATDTRLQTTRTAEYVTAVVGSKVECEGKVIAPGIGAASVLLQAPAGAPADKITSRSAAALNLRPF